MNTFSSEYIRWFNFVKEQFRKHRCSDYAFLFTKSISMRSVYRFFLFESEQHVRCRRRRNVSGLRRCTFDLTESRRFFFHPRIYFSSLIRNISLTPFNLISFFLSFFLRSTNRMLYTNFYFLFFSEF